MGSADPFVEQFQVGGVVDEKLLVAGPERGVGLIKGAFFDELAAFGRAFLCRYPKDGGLLGRSSGKGNAVGDGKCERGGETGLAGFGVASQEDEVADRQQTFDEPCQFFEFVVIVERSEETVDEAFAREAFPFLGDGVFGEGGVVPPK